MLRSSWGNTKHRPPAGAQPIGTLSLWNDLWLVKVSHRELDLFKAWKQSYEEEQKSSFLSEHFLPTEALK